MKNLTFEGALVRLEQIAELLEGGSKSLEESLELFQESAELVKYCQQQLDEAEKKIQLLTKNDSGFSTTTTDTE